MLPILELSDTLANAFRSRNRVLLHAPTGSGKSTQLPQILLRAGLLDAGQCVILQPRRIAARMLAKRVAEELGVALGQEVGYQIRFENVTSKATRIRFVTEGLLLRQMINDPELRGVAVLLFDEFHERHLDGDIGLARALDIQEGARPDLRVGVMSATLDIESLAIYLGNAEIVSSSGRMFPVAIDYLGEREAKEEADTPVWELAARKTMGAMGNATEGDALVFMPGAYEIGRTVEALRAMAPANTAVLPLHGELPPAEQDRAVGRTERGGRKIIVATNVAETSLTIDGVTVVVDAGLARVPRFDPHRGINTLLVEKISRASADQRAGRAGRTAPGLCLRLWSEREHLLRPAREAPEIRRLDLAEVLLALRAAGVRDPFAFRWLEAPDPKALLRADLLLKDLGAVREDGGLTDEGRRMVAFPTHPRFARMLIEAGRRDCVRPVALIAALAQGRNLLLRNVDKRTDEMRSDVLGSDDADSDFFVLSRAFRYAETNGFRPDACARLGIHAATAKQIVPVLQALLRLAKSEGMQVDEPDGGRDARGAESNKRAHVVRTPVENPIFAIKDGKTPVKESESARRDSMTMAADLNAIPVAKDAPAGESLDTRIRRCVLAGFSDQLARRVNASTLRCEVVHGRVGELARESALRKAELFVASEIREIEQRGDELNTVLSLATAVDPAWLAEMFPASDMEEKVIASYDVRDKRVVAETQTRFRGLALSSKRMAAPPSGEAARLLALAVGRGDCSMPAWDEAVEQWITRLGCLARWAPELEIAPIGVEERQLILEQALEGCASAKEVKEAAVWPVLRGWLSPAMNAVLEKEAPERLALPNGRSAKVVYSDSNPPTMGATIQNLYGVKEGFKIAFGRIDVLMQVLAPNQRPIQVTASLANFWAETYPKVRGELSRRYPRHEWR